MHTLQKLTANEAAIVEELNAAQGKAMDIDGYYFADEQLASAAMRPSETFNQDLGSLLFLSVYFVLLK